MASILDENILSIILSYNDSNFNDVVNQLKSLNERVKVINEQLTGIHSLLRMPNGPRMTLERLVFDYT